MVKVFYEIIINYQLGLQSYEDFTGTREPASKMAGGLSNLTHWPLHIVTGVSS